ncbi:MAG: hypothetical protein ACOX1P_16350 [Thermoguttaceae bacterium]|jgi:hypothetical protein
MARIEAKSRPDLPPGVEVLGYERCGDRREHFAPFRRKRVMYT